MGKYIRKIMVALLYVATFGISVASLSAIICANSCWDQESI